MKNRLIAYQLSALHQKTREKFIVLTGARQTGKTTLARHLFPDHHYISLDDPIERVNFERLSSKDWLFIFPSAIVDEIQKLPSLFEVLKACYDQDSNARYVILGSSQILLLKRVKESLAGRVAIGELFPFTLSEIITDTWEDCLHSNLIGELIKQKDKEKVIDLIQSNTRDDQYLAKALLAFENLLLFGGMPPSTVIPAYYLFV